MTTIPITAETIQAIIDGCEGVTPGPWHYENPGDDLSTGWVNDNDPLNDGGSLATTWAAGRPAGEGKRTASHIARLDPDTVRAICTLALSALTRSVSPDSPASETVEAVPVAWADWDYDDDGPFVTRRREVADAWNGPELEPLYSQATLQSITADRDRLRGERDEARNGLTEAVEYFTGIETDGAYDLSGFLPKLRAILVKIGA